MNKPFITLGNQGILAKTLEVSKFPTLPAVQIEWPFSVEHKGKTYYWYAKPGTENKTGLPCACYKLGEEGKDVRLWLRCDGEITED